MHMNVASNKVSAADIGGQAGETGKIEFYLEKEKPSEKQPPGKSVFPQANEENSIYIRWIGFALVVVLVITCYKKRRPSE